MANTKWKWAVGGGLVLLCGFGAASHVHAGPWRGHRAQSAAEVRAFMERRADRLLETVDADDAQRERIDAIIAQDAPQMFALMQEGRAVREELKAALLADRVDANRIAQGKRKLSALAERMADLGVDGLASVAEVLTPAQRRQIADKLTQHLPE